MVLLLAYNSNNPGDDDAHGASSAGLHLAVEGAAVQGNPKTCRLVYRVLLGMNGAHAVLPRRPIFVDHLSEEMANIVTVGHPRRRPDVSRTQNALVFHNHAPASPTVAGRPRGDCTGEAHEVFIPAGPGHGQKLQPPVELSIVPGQSEDAQVGNL